MYRNFVFSEYTLRNKQYQAIIGSGFSHIGMLHMGLNMLGLWFFGTALEYSLGPAGLLTLYLAGHLGGIGAIYL